MDIHVVTFVVTGAFVGGLVTGLAGFGTGLTALIFWLVVLPPPVAATLVVVCSVAAQAQSLPTVWRTLKPGRLLPFVVPGLLGVPLGTTLLTGIDVRSFKLFVGLLLVCYALQSLVFRAPKPVTAGGRFADGIAGLGGGILGGLAGPSGPIPTMWVNMRGWSKDHKRGVIQGFNLAILVIALVSHFLGGFLTLELLTTAVIALPVTAIGTFVGVRFYGRLSDRQFTNIVLLVLGASGALMLLANI